MGEMFTFRMKVSQSNKGDPKAALIYRTGETEKPSSIAMQDLALFTHVIVDSIHNPEQASGAPLQIIFLTRNQARYRATMLDPAP